MIRSLYLEFFFVPTRMVGTCMFADSKFFSGILSSSWFLYAVVIFRQSGCQVVLTSRPLPPIRAIPLRNHAALQVMWGNLDTFCIVFLCYLEALIISAYVTCSGNAGTKNLAVAVLNPSEKSSEAIVSHPDKPDAQLVSKKPCVEKIQPRTLPLLGKPYFTCIICKSHVQPPFQVVMLLLTARFQLKSGASPEAVVLCCQGHAINNSYDHNLWCIFTCMPYMTLMNKTRQFPQDGDV